MVKVKKILIIYPRIINLVSCNKTKTPHEVISSCGVLNFLTIQLFDFLTSSLLSSIYPLLPLFQRRNPTMEKIRQKQRYHLYNDVRHDLSTTAS